MTGVQTCALPISPTYGSTGSSIAVPLADRKFAIRASIRVALIVDDAARRLTSKPKARIISTSMDMKIVCHKRIGIFVTGTEIQRSGDMDYVSAGNT